MQDALHFLAGGGEMGALMRVRDWSRTSLGDPAGWPQALRTAVRLILNCAHPMYIFWGSEGACLYNDAYRQSIGPERHPTSLGQPARKVWDEIWDIIGPQIEQVMVGGRATWHENALVPITRNGRRDDVYWTYTYSPIDDETSANGVGGVLVVCSETTKYVLAERRATLEGERFLRLFEQAPTIMAVLRGPEHRFEYANPRYFQLIGHRELVGKTVADALPDAAAQGYVDILGRVYQSGEAYVGKGAKYTVQITPGGKTDTRHIDFVYQPIRDAEGRVDGIFVEGVDVTDREMAAVREKALTELGDRLREFDDPDDIAYAAAEILGRALEVSRAGYGTIDLAAETISIERDWNMPGIKSLAGVLRFRDYGSYIDNLKRGVTVAIENADDDPRTAKMAEALKAISAQSFVNMPVTEQGGFVALLYLNHATARSWSVEELAFIREVAQRTRIAVERRRAEIALRKSEHRLKFLDALATSTRPLADADTVLAVTTRMVGEHMGVAICAYADVDDDQDGFTIRGDWSAPGASSIVGHYRLRDFGALAVERLRAGNPLVISDVDAELPPDGAEAFHRLGIASAICKPLIKEGRLVAMMAVHDQVPRRWTDDERALIHQVTERSWTNVQRVRIEADLRASEENFRTLTRAMPNQAWTARPDGMLDWFNEQVYAYSGAAAGSLDGVGWSTLVHPDDLPYATERWKTALVSGEAYEVEFRLRRADGEYRWQIARAVPIKNTLGQVIRWVGTNTDIQDQKIATEALSSLAETLDRRVQERTTELFATEEKLRQSQKMEVMGQLTGGIAHDFNNLMAGVISAVSLTRRRIAANRLDDIDQFMEAADASARRAATLTQRLLAFSRRQPLSSAPCNLATLVRDMKDLLRQTLGESVTYGIESDDDLWLALVDGHQFENAVLNLVINARDAMPEGGRLTIRIRNQRLEISDPRSGDEVDPGDFIEFSVSDTGTGMAPDVIAQAFEPFYSTKPVGQGTGLGLPMVYGFARQSGGLAHIKSEVGKGTTVILLLPRAQQSPMRGEDTQAQGATASGRGETILIVEDDPTVRLLAIATLQDLGYCCLEAADARGALPIIQSDRHLDLLLTDVGLPFINGRQLADMAREKRPSLKVLFMTGYAEKAASREAFLGRGMDLIIKPFDEEALATLIRSLLQSP